MFGWNNGQAGFVRVTEATTLPPFSVYAQLDSTDDFVPLSGEDTGIKEVSGERLAISDHVYDLSGRKIVNGKSVNGKLSRGIYIVNGQKVMVK